ncbi:MAG: outer membrane protein assembly factor BamA [Acidobacteria bacterium]|nr:outer membrane protein assembly factor BamA [Acidobacteriota bacterium]
MRHPACTIFIAILIAAAGCREEGKIRVDHITFRGVRAIDVDRLRAALATKQSSILPWGRQQYFNQTQFDADLQRIQAFYADRGFPDARVTHTDVQLNEAQDAVNITITIDEGAPITVAAVNFVGFDVLGPERLANLQSRIPLKVGAPRDRQSVVDSREMAVNELKDHGYPNAVVAAAEDDGPNGKRATLTFTAVPGMLAHVGRIEVVGNTSVSDRVIERELTIRPGDLYQRSALQDSQRRLYGMELFQFANVETLDAGEPPGEVAIRVTVVEGKHQRVNFGVGYGTEEKARADAEYRHLNFLGGARSAGVHARWSSLDRGLRLDFNQPYLFRPHVSFGAEAQHWRTLTPAYGSIVTGGRATLTYRKNPRFTWSASFTSEHDSSAIANDVLTDLTLRNDLIALGLDPTTGEQNGTLDAFGVDLQASTADSLLDPHHGYQLILHGEQAGRLLPGDFAYFAASADARQYLPLFGARVVVASRVQLGSIDPAAGDPANVPFSKKYFLGGSTSLRGWGRYEVSPLSGSGLPIGGTSLFAWSEELRVGLAGKLSGVLFLDSGNVWADPWTVRLNDLRYAVGPGLRYDTPVGPIRVDLGFQLNPIDGLLVNGEPQKRPWRLHVSIGQAF